MYNPLICRPDDHISEARVVVRFDSELAEETSETRTVRVTDERWEGFDEMSSRKEVVWEKLTFRSRFLGLPQGQVASMLGHLIYHMT